MSSSHALRWLVVASILLVTVWTGHGEAAGVAGSRLPIPPQPPEQPAHGPGGTDRLYEAVSATRIGQPPFGHWLFEPTSRPLHAPPPRPERPLPLVILLHGYSALDPEAYRAWIDHIVERGAVVVFPDFQTVNPLAAGGNDLLRRSSSRSRRP